MMVISGMLAHAEIYKWIDENGRTYYGEKPPDENATRLDINNTPSTVEESVEERLEKREKLLEIYEEERNIKKEQKLKAEQEEIQKKRKCIQLADRLKSMERGGTYYILDEDGNRKYVSEETVSETRKALEDTYNRECK